MIRSMWRRFRPKRVGSLQDKTLYEADSLYTRARSIVNDTLREARTDSRAPRGSLRTVARAVKKLDDRQVHDPEHLLAKLILQSPGAAKAQRAMDKQGGYKNRHARLYELIGFNDAFVDTVLALDEQDLPKFVERYKHEMAVFCRRVHVAPFDDTQFEAIVHGLSREIAVYRGAHQLGYHVHMTSRMQDAMGVDMIISDPESKKSLPIDVKTNSSFHFRLLDLQREKRVDEEKRMYCELAGFCIIRNGKGAQAVDTVLFRVATKYLGPIYNFSFRDLQPLNTLIRHAMDDHGVYVLDGVKKKL